MKRVNYKPEEQAEETCVFLTPGKTDKCSVLTEPCPTGRARQTCPFHKTERQFYEERNAAIQKNRQKGNCDRCKYKSQKCELLKIGDEVI